MKQSLLQKNTMLAVTCNKPWHQKNYSTYFLHTKKRNFTKTLNPDKKVKTRYNSNIFWR